MAIHDRSFQTTDGASNMHMQKVGFSFGMKVGNTILAGSPANNHLNVETLAVKFALSEVVGRNNLFYSVGR